MQGDHRVRLTELSASSPAVFRDGDIISRGLPMVRKRTDPRLQPLWLTVVGLGVILLAGAGFLLLRPPAQPLSTEEAVQTLSPETVPRVSLTEARTAYESGSAIFVDVRDEGSFKSGHIPGALSIPLSALPQRENELDRSAWIITYCT
jgi:hypothetical protein